MPEEVSLYINTNIQYIGLHRCSQVSMKQRNNNEKKRQRMYSVVGEHKTNFVYNIFTILKLILCERNIIYFHRLQVS